MNGTPCVRELAYAVNGLLYNRELKRKAFRYGIYLQRTPRACNSLSVSENSLFTQATLAIHFEKGA